MSIGLELLYLMLSFMVLMKLCYLAAMVWFLAYDQVIGFMCRLHNCIDSFTKIVDRSIIRWGREGVEYSGNTNLLLMYLYAVTCDLALDLFRYNASECIQRFMLLTV